VNKKKLEPKNDRGKSERKEERKKERKIERKKEVTEKANKNKSFYQIFSTLYEKNAIHFEFETRCQLHQRYTHSFYVRRLLKHNKDWQLDCIFALLGSAHIKAARKMLIKLTPGPYFFNVLRAAFTHKDLKTVINTVKLSICLCFWDLRT